MKITINDLLLFAVTRLNKYDYFFFLGLAFWFIETWYFGFNATAKSPAEAMCDILAISLAGYGLICGIVGSIKIQTELTINNNLPKGTSMGDISLTDD